VTERGREREIKCEVADGQVGKEKCKEFWARFSEKRLVNPAGKAIKSYIYIIEIYYCNNLYYIIHKYNKSNKYINI